MAKYSFEEKLEAVMRVVEDGMSLRDSAKILGTAKEHVRRWVMRYQQFGEAGLLLKHYNYTGEFKVSVVEYMHNTGASARQTTAHFNIPSTQLVSKWEQIYYEQGKEALYIDNRGCSPKMKNTKNNTSKKNNVDTNEDLLAEVQRLRMENAYLKKLNALIQEREKSEKKTK